MSSSVIIGAIAIVLVFVGVAGFGVYRYMGTKQRKDDEKQFMQDYSVSKVNNTMDATPMRETNVQRTPGAYDFTTLDVPSTKATPE